MHRIELFEFLTERDSVNDKEEGNQSSGGGEKKLYPAGRCRVCKKPLPQVDPLDICFRCQDLGIDGNPRKPVGKNKKR